MSTLSTTPDLARKSIALTFVFAVTTQPSSSIRLSFIVTFRILRFPAVNERVR